MSDSSYDKLSSGFSTEPMKMESIPCLTPSQFGLKMYNLHNLIHVENGLKLKPYLWIQVKLLTEQQRISLTSVSEIISLIPNHPTKITRYDSHQKFTVTISLGGIKPAKDPSTIYGNRGDQGSLWSPQSCDPHHMKQTAWAQCND